ncbi:MAG: FKBP-type peptidyl-prolyl cis-trans isomerase [Isosphaeraceae bacterium]|nr:FKBP-type peptidyl-prolyl cis-trans isomerase [Isosphaeraceae bacterium]
MNGRRPRFAPAFSVVNETLERRIVLSGVASASALHQRAVEVSAKPGQKAGTETTLAVSAGTLGQPVTFTVTVRAAAAAGSPAGTVNIVDHGQVVQTLVLSPTTSTNGKYAFSSATATLTQQPGASAYFFGKHSVTAEFIPTGTFSKSSGNKTFTVSQPNYTALANGVKIATIVPGSGPQIQSGQTASVLYTGYLAKNGQIFDDSINHGGAPFSFTLGTGAVIPGFDAGTVGMQAGETRIVMIPAAEGYGAHANGPIPANSTLIFVLTLKSIS